MAGQKPTESVLDIIQRRVAPGNVFSFTSAVSAIPGSTARKIVKKVNRNQHSNLGQAIAMATSTYLIIWRRGQRHIVAAACRSRG